MEKQDKLTISFLPSTISCDYIKSAAVQQLKQKKKFRALERCKGFAGGSVIKTLPDNPGVTGDSGSIPGSGRFPGIGNGHQLQYSCWENPMDRGAWWATVHGVAESWTRLDNCSHMYAQRLAIITSIIPNWYGSNALCQTSFLSHMGQILHGLRSSWPLISCLTEWQGTGLAQTDGGSDPGSIIARSEFSSSQPQFTHL